MYKHVAYMLALAQRASDVGKYWKLDDEATQESDALALLLTKADQIRSWEQGYHLKDYAIINAIEGIRHNPQSGFSYYVTIAADKKAHFIVYFNFKIENKRYQVSFHSFDKKNLNRYLKGSQAHQTHWDEKKSREACIKLMQSFN